MNIPERVQHREEDTVLSVVFVGGALFDEIDMVYGNGYGIGVDDPFSDRGFQSKLALDRAMLITVPLAEGYEIRDAFIRT